MRLLVCGGRDYTDFNTVFKTLNKYRSSILSMCTGEAKGADTLAASWAKANKIDYQPYPADWNKYKDLAGPMRNSYMLRDFKPTHFIAFKGGSGTADMTTKCLAQGVIQLEVIYHEGLYEDD